MIALRQGDVVIVDFGPPRGSEPGWRRPCVILQNNLFNTSKIATSIVAALTTNLSRAKAPGNVLLGKGEANLPEPSVVNVSQLFTISKSDALERMGTLPRERLRDVLAGVALVLEPREAPLQS